MRHLLCLTVLVALAARGPAQDPGPPSIEQLIEKYTEARTRRVDAEKAEAEAKAVLEKRARELQDKLEKLFGPPAPPPKPPEPPAPADPLLKKVRDAFDSDPTQLDKKRDQAKDLAALCRQVAILAADKDVATSGDLAERVAKASRALIGEGALRGCRQIMVAELAALLPFDDTLTADQRAAVTALFKKLAAAFEEVAR